MKSAGPILFAAALLLVATARAQDDAVADKPYASIVSRNMFALVAIPPPPTNSPEPTEPLPKITPNGIMTIFGKLEALYKVAGKGKPGQPAKEDSYVLSVGERQDDIEVIKINQPDGIVTFNNHGTIQELPLVAAANTSAPAGPGGPAGGVPPGAIIAAPPRPGGMPPADRGLLRGRPGGRTPMPSIPTGSAPETNPGGVQPQASTVQQPPKSIEDQVMSAAREMAIIEQNRIATQEAVDLGMLPPLPPTLLTPADATAHDGAPLIATPDLPPPAGKGPNYPRK